MTVLAQAWKPALLVAGLLAAGFALRAMGVDRLVNEAGGQGPWVFCIMAALACAVGVPRQAVAYAGGLAFGFWPGAALALLAEVIGCLLDFVWARAIGRAWAERWVRRGGRLERLERVLSGNAFTATLAIRLLPVGHNLTFNIVAGVSSVSAAPFLLASALGYVPQTAVFALLGGGVRVSQGTQLLLGAALLVLSIALGALLLRRGRVPI